MRNTLMTAISLFMLILGLVSCDPCKDLTVTVFLTQEIKDYFFVFKPGNYWIYENQDGTKRDSVSVARNEIVPNIGSLSKCTAYETLEIGFNNSLIFQDINPAISTFYIDNTQMRVSSYDNRFYLDETWSTISDIELPDMTINNQVYTTPFVLRGDYDEITG